MRYEICLAGAGGQGLVLAGIILAEAAGIYEGLHVVQYQSYGPEARGGASRADVIISDTTIFYPQVRQIDMLLALTHEAYTKYHQETKPSGIIIVDSFYVSNTSNAFKGPKIYSLPLSEISKKVAGKELFTNIVSLAVVAKLSNLINYESLKKAVINRVPASTIDLNLKALEAGFSLSF